MGKGIGLLLELGAAMSGDRIAVGRGVEAITFAQLEERATAAATYVAASDARSVVYVGQIGPAFHVALFASALAGVPITSLNYRLADAQIAGLIDQLDAPLVVADEAYIASLADRPRVYASSTLLSELPPAHDRPLPDVDDDSPAVVLFTSGTTSVPKGVVLRHSHLISYVLSTVDPGSADEGDTALVCVPPYHVAGIGTVLTNTVAGRRVVHLADFTARDWLDAVAEERVTSAMLVPTMLARIVDELDGSQAVAPTLRSIAYGGSRIPAPVLAKALSAFPDAGFVNAYGLTETSSTIALLGPDDHRAALCGPDPAARARLSSVGRFVPGVEGEIRDDEGNVLATGSVGELWVRGPQVSGEYLRTGSVVDEAGWFPTRDRAHLDADGYLFVEGRADDTIIRGGENIAPAEVEDVIAEHPAVREVVVVGLPDEEWGERLVAVVVARAPVAPEELRAFVRARLRGSRTPDDIIVREDELPKTPTGKLLRRELVDDLLAPR
ncbi:acyl-CoA synthetase (AMP-forming)/AMP-acid ligase II [Nocardioides ginsengisegetis]|uniref:Acyl-CoA synthetase (AMP-forming)/AMP-acid ligase II n=1 Tax=Nocardioides ginsengisegetis TaxID=661491 RepID=A0A7W3J2C1_9ACTN|nr:fatty acid--CoA ligase family protein [Nocardioides ginsengisegetis]MBA8804905.1 acyl-CoA synthetase (AMP-forming)/AMP-acid ligase II [Nocardioides ginsengisegetis]